MTQANLSLKRKQRLTDIQNRLVVAKGEREEGREGLEFGISRRKPLYIEWKYKGPTV